jgi:hypothetical protein
MLRGILPSAGTPAVDEAVAKKTADKVHEVWGSDNDKVFGWGRPVLAMNAARLGEPGRAIGYLTAFDYWVFDDAGFAERGGNGEFPLLWCLAKASLSGRSRTRRILLTVDLRWHASSISRRECIFSICW